MKISEGVCVGIVCMLISCTDASTVTCGPGTMLQDDACVAEGSSPGGGTGLACGTGTHQDGTTCLPDGPNLTCASGTHQEGITCVPNGPDLMCGTGTHQDGNTCVPDGKALYQLRAFTTGFDADGHTKMPVLVIGTNPDGSPATDRVVLNTDRAGAGSWVDPSPTVGELGTMANFVPCNATTPGCVGPLRLTLALASDPRTIVAHLDVDLTMPDGVGSTAPCMVANKAMYFDGHDWIFNGTMTVTDASWGGFGSQSSISIHLTPSDDHQGLWWDLDFDTRQLGSDLVPGVYEMAQRAPFAGPGHPGLEVTGDGRGCNTISGRFEVHVFELQPSSSTIKRALVSFEQHCEGGPAILSGCVRFEP